MPQGRVRPQFTRPRQPLARAAPSNRHLPTRQTRSLHRISHIPQRPILCCQSRNRSHSIHLSRPPSKQRMFRTSCIQTLATRRRLLLLHRNVKGIKRLGQTLLPRVNRALRRKAKEGRRLLTCPSWYTKEIGPRARLQRSLSTNSR